MKWAKSSKPSRSFASAAKSEEAAAADNTAVISTSEDIAAKILIVVRVAESVQMKVDYADSNQAYELSVYV